MVRSTPTRRILCLAALLCAAASCATAREPVPSTVLLLSWDGTRAEAWRGLEALGALAAQGAAAERLVPVFPTNTFPNHVTLVTGVAPEVHGIVNNSFWDPERGAYERDPDPSWIEVAPLWAWLDRHGVVSAAYHWVGSEGPWRDGHGPRYWKPFDASTPSREKVDQILAWLALPAAERPRLVTAWFRGGDSAGHRHGPHAEQVRRALEAEDAELARLVQTLRERGAWAHTTLIALSDHGMEAVERYVDLPDLLEEAGLEATIWGGGGVALLTGPGARGAVAAARARGLEAHVPAEASPELRLGNPRFGGAVVIAPPGTGLVRGRLGRLTLRGSHGYRPEHAAMGALFVAAGRGVASGTALGEVEAVDVAPTLLELLGVERPAWMEGEPIPGLLQGLADGERP